MTVYFPTQITIRVLNSNRTLCGGFTLYYKLMNSQYFVKTLKIQKNLKEVKMGRTESRTKSQNSNIPHLLFLIPNRLSSLNNKTKNQKNLGISNYLLDCALRGTRLTRGTWRCVHHTCIRLN